MKVIYYRDFCLLLLKDICNGYHNEKGRLGKIIQNTGATLQLTEDNQVMQHQNHDEQNQYALM